MRRQTLIDQVDLYNPRGVIPIVSTLPHFLAPHTRLPLSTWLPPLRPHPHLTPLPNSTTPCVLTRPCTHTSSMPSLTPRTARRCVSFVSCLDPFGFESKHVWEQVTLIGITMHSAFASVMASRRSERPSRLSTRPRPDHRGARLPVWPAPRKEPCFARTFHALRQRPTRNGSA